MHQFKAPWLIAVLSLLLASVAMAQDQSMSPEEMAAMQEYMAMMAPGEHHKHLEYFVGKWNVSSKMWMGGPGSTPMESKGTSECKWVLGGRFVQEDYNGEMMGMPYIGTGLYGYDNWRNLYVGNWYNNMSTAILSMTGQRDPSGKKFTYYGEMDEPTLKVTGRMVKYVTTILGPDQYKMEIIDLHASDDYKVVELTYDRVK